MNRSAPLARRTPINRGKGLARSPMRRGGKRSSYALRDRDFDFMRWVRRQPCAVRADQPDPNRLTPCSGPVEADHMGERGLSRKADDATCVPLCRRHHRERTDHAGCFRALTREEARAWRARAIERTQAEWATRPAPTR